MKKQVYLYTLVSALGGLLFGFDIACINGAIPFFSEYFKLSEVMTGWAVSALLIGCMPGALIAGTLADRYGFKKVLKWLAFLFFITAIGAGLSTSFNWFVIFRFLGGIAVGGSSVLCPMYIAEIAPAKYRGRLAVTFQLAIVIGVLIAFAVDLLFLHAVYNWRWMIITEALPAILFFFMLFYVRESPRWLAKKGRFDEAEQVIRLVSQDSNIENVMSEIQNSIEIEKSGKKINIFKPPFLKLVLIGASIGMMNQFTGTNAVMYYATDIFRTAGFSADSAAMQTLIIGIVNLVFTLIGMKIIDTVGRKNMLMYGSIVMAIFLGVFSWAYISGNNKGLMPLIMLLGFIAAFEMSQGAVIWVILSEMFPNNIRARGASIGTFSHWFFNALIALMFPIIVGILPKDKGTGYIFAFFAVATFLSFFFIRKFIVETKGKSLEKLELELLNNKS
jgi:sugar porter (SP) family MFS transporter